MLLIIILNFETLPVDYPWLTLTKTPNPCQGLGFFEGQKILTSTPTLLTLTLVPLRVCKPLHITTKGREKRKRIKGIIQRVCTVSWHHNILFYSTAITSYFKWLYSQKSTGSAVDVTVTCIAWRDRRHTYWALPTPTLQAPADRSAWAQTKIVCCVTVHQCVRKVGERCVFLSFFLDDLKIWDSASLIAHWIKERRNLLKLAR